MGNLRPAQLDQLAEILSKVLYPWHHGPETVAVCRLMVPALVGGIQRYSWVLTPPSDGIRPAGGISPDRPTPPEVTPAMYAAGSAALGPFYMGEDLYDLREPALTAVYLAMAAAAK